VIAEFIALAGVFAASAGTSIAQATAPKPLKVAPPDALFIDCYHDGCPVLRYDAEFECRYTFSVNDKRVSFDWTRWSKGSSSSRYKIADNSESFATAYWPTYALPAGPYRLCVAGKRTSGETVLERWTFAATNATGKHCPSVDPPDPDACYANAQNWNLPPRTRVDPLIVLAPDDPRGTIRAMFPSLKSADVMFVYYNSSRELYAVDVAANTQALQASPTGSASLLSVPDLKSEFRRFWSADYTNKGYCYFLGPSLGVLYPEMPNHTLVLIDSDRDGKIDSAQPISAKAWTTDGWGDVANIARR
jgi:hypothetical protein